MAYQPIEMTARPPMLDAWSQLNQTLGQRRQEAHQAGLEEQARKRQDHADFVSAYLQAKKLADSGDHAGAAAVMSRFKGRHGETPSALATPSAPAAAPGPAPQGGSPMPDSMEFQRPPQMPQEEGPDGVGPDGRPVPGPIDQGFVDSLPMGAPPPPGPPTAAQSLMGAAPGARPPPPADHPLVAANEASKARDQQRGHDVLYFTPPGGGPEQSYDPQAAREAHLQQRAQELDGLAAQSGPEFQAVYAELRPALIQNDQMDTTDIVKVINNRAAAKQAEEMQGRREAQHKADWEAKETEWEAKRKTAERGQNLSLEGRRLMAEALGAGNPLKVDTGNRADTARLETAVKDVVSMADGKSLVRSDRALRQAITNVAAKGPDAVTAHKDAFLQLERYFKGGGTPTEGEAKLLLHHLGGIPGAVQQFLADAQTGDFSDITKQNLARAASIAKGELDENVHNFMGALQERVGPGSEFEGMGSNVNRMVKSVGRIYNLELPDLYQGDAGKKQITLGSGERSPAAKPKAAAPKGTAAPSASAPGRPKSNEEYLRLYQGSE